MDPPFGLAISLLTRPLRPSQTVIGSSRDTRRFLVAPEAARAIRWPRYHIDDLARFVSTDTIVAAVEGNRDDANHVPLANNLQRLRAATDQRSRRLNIVELPMPAPVIFRGRRLPASYANFYIANRCVLAPVFNDPNDRRALNILADLFPDREIIPIYCGDLIWGLGAIHCMTMQQPA